MESRAIARWGCRQALGRPIVWCIAAALLVLVPLSRALSPFPGLGIDPTASLVTGWAPVVAWLGASLAILFLTRHEAFLELLPASGRRSAELQVLLLAPIALQGCLLLGAVWGSGLNASDLAGWIALCALIDLHVAAVGYLALRAPGGGAVRVASLWALLWSCPALVGDGWLSMLCAPIQGLGELQLPLDLPRALLATLLCCLVFLLGATLVESQPRRARLGLH